MGKVIKSIFGGGGGSDNSELIAQQQAQQAQIDKMNAENEARKLAQQEAAAREQATQAARKGRAEASLIAGYEETAALRQKSLLGPGQ